VLFPVQSKTTVIKMYKSLHLDLPLFDGLAWLVLTLSNRVLLFEGAEAGTSLKSNGTVFFPRLIRINFARFSSVG
jgi:hypothetical protein